MEEREEGLPISGFSPEYQAGFVAIIGRPNVGKSTLMNALTGEKLSITSHKASTTRHRIFGIMTGENFQMVYSDTPGLIAPAYELQKNMMCQVQMALEDADLILAITDNLKPGTDEELLAILKKAEVPVLLVVNKIDLSSPEKIKEKSDAWKKEMPDLDILAVSAKESFNVEGVFSWLKERLPKHPPYYPADQLTEQSERFFAAEMLREQVFQFLEKEIPYSTTVAIEQFKDTEELLRISALLVVERNSQKAILLGHQGKTIKKIATRARLEMEKFFGKKVFLETYVKVEEDWRKDKNKLKRLGYGAA